ncbi:MAG TPA: cell envelope integrity protein TolA [Thermodesulfobacteriota bacterium]|nr:cell envelope integrity protein TolA [Thermodesulfobacteriota bacterium]
MAKKEKKSKPTLFFGFILSAGLHLFIVATVLFWGFNSPALIKQPKSITANLVSLPSAGSSGQRGSSGPKKEAAPKPPPPKKEIKPEIVEKKPEKVKIPEVVKKPPKKVDPPKPKPEKKNTVNLNDKKTVKKQPKPTPKPVKKVVKKTPSAEQKRKKIMEEMLAKAEKKERQQTRSDVLENLKKSSTKQVAKAGSDGYDITGAPTGSNSASAGLFVERVRQEIASNWNMPPNIPTDGSLESKVLFKINASGEVFGIRIIKSSGNSAFDEFCKRALKKASPLDIPPPPEIQREAEIEGVEVTFNNSSY